MGDVPGHFDVIIVGGRPAGSTLAARLGRAGLHVLLLEKVKFPNADIVSSPVIAAISMHLLDEIEAPESEYAYNTPKIRHSIIQIREKFAAPLLGIPRFGRDYSLAVERGRFDDALWRHAAKQPNVTALDSTSVVDLLWADSRVVGVKVLNPDKSNSEYTADCVIGADGRFSFVARKVDAQITHEATQQYPTSVYFAYWKNVKPYDERGACIQIYSTAEGMGVLMLDSADNTTAIVLEGRADLLVPPDNMSAEDFYVETLKKLPGVWKRLADAEPILPVRGMRNISHFYRVSHGPGWALVGDAVHAVDPLDGQGIFDALFSAKILGEALIDWKCSRKTWDEALADYDKALMAETYPVYQTTLERRKVELYDPRPEWMLNTILRWLITDETYRRKLALYLARAADPDNWLPKWVFPLAIIRGLFKDVRRFIQNKPPRSNQQSEAVSK